MEATVSQEGEPATIDEVSCQDLAENGTYWRRSTGSKTTARRRAPPGFFMGLFLILVIVGLFFVGLSEWILSVS